MKLLTCLCLMAWLGLGKAEADENKGPKVTDKVIFSSFHIKLRNEIFLLFSYSGFL